MCHRENMIQKCLFVSSVILMSKQRYLTQQQSDGLYSCEDSTPSITYKLGDSEEEDAVHHALTRAVVALPLISCLLFFKRQFSPRLFFLYGKIIRFNPRLSHFTAFITMVTASDNRHC